MAVAGILIGSISWTAVLPVPLPCRQRLHSAVAAASAGEDPDAS